ncbi:hypothetical protein ABB37_07320 [Leptomonas pyrrhocoris]|uniref:Optic atrophy 3 protein (OPA3) n=1 Tax=Leptomonas pyrrhocoris TaxID=157538 RepID=A0A0N0DT37_LEPPY|nr:hypothetical protein ABB37_07320 [Leptomonas pyrrhocoris]XP_015655381.1 hypothetical protein ABB37_07320 [Leptomonas pyrrhocoris]XP_015655382.1 hypothetical protein ABB37_07320 [Leptomonas pyrrhocoris]KPA76941.1 hypothetical protein ABB37_07320 [Leptomonas pyrrhocoris]KPA76942.1 hypothetical protein ABB37_07320 [Leptomonas pyrrhocoris]KPA76943.1 hypothetical protein ABB37_07320 [Leptomonas pyrrhocoris]|eukprot:XP_015655380.1 hypothetical protein ABB37_07320 [Leptomonas pyrrhocoris]
MVALPAFKFVFLAIRQVTRPLAKQIVQRANTKRALTYRMCIGLGRVSLGLSGVIAEWTRAEEQKQREAKKKSEEAQVTRLAQAAEAEMEKAAEMAKRAAEAVMNAVGKHSAGGSTAAAAAVATPKVAPTTSATAPSSSPGEHPSPQRPSTSAERTSAASSPSPSPSSSSPANAVLSTPAPATAATVTPRSRSLLRSVVYGPQLKDSPADTYDSTVFLDPTRTVGEAARVFIRYPARSSWDVFRQTFLAPFPEDRLVAAGADLLIELVAYTVLCTLLIVELLQQSRTTAAKEAHVNARLEAIEAKVNELVEQNNESRAYPPLEELPPVPELQVTGRLSALWGAVTTGAGLVGSAFSSSDDDDDGSSSSSHRGSAAEERERMSQSGKVVVPRREVGSNIARAPPRDPAVKVSKYDESTVVQVELEKLLHGVRAETRA